MTLNKKLVVNKKASPATHSEDGVDLTLIRWMLSLTPAERLQVLQRHIQSIEEIRARNQKAGKKDKATLPVLRRTLEERSKKT